MELSRGATIALLGVVLFVVTMGASAAMAPSLDVERAGTAGTPTPTPTDDGPAGTATGTSPAGTATAAPAPGTATPDGPRTLVGMQGTWARHGSVFLQSDDGEVWREGSTDSYFEVSSLDDGTILAAFANESETDCGDLKVPCGRTGFRHIDPGPDGPEIIAEYSFPVGSMTNSEVHAVDRISDGTYVFTDMDQERVVVVDNGTEVWEWRASSFYDAPADPTSRDWLHINDVDVIDEDRFLVSVRNANQILVIERGAGVAKVINADDGGDDSSCTKSSQLDDFDGDGEVRCGDPSVINHQHNPQWVGPGVVLVADSDNDRVVELHESDDGDWEPAWVLEEANGIPLHWPRDADRLPNGHTLVTDTLNKRVFEIDDEGTVVWSAGTKLFQNGEDNGLPYEADRLPVGESAGLYERQSTATDTGSPSSRSDKTPLPTADRNGNMGGDIGSDIPGLTLAVVGLRGTFSWIPFWFAELQLAVTVLSALLVVGGGVDHWRTEVDRSILSSLSHHLDR